MRAVVQVFMDMFDDEVDLYWLSVKFMKCLDQSAAQLDKLVTFEVLSNAHYSTSIKFLGQCLSVSKFLTGA